MSLYPPDDPYLLNVTIFGIPIVVRWYGVIIMCGALLAALWAERRATARGENREHVWNLLVIGLVVAVACARAYYVLFEWQHFEGRPLLEIINPATGGLAIHGAIIGGLLTAWLYTRYHRLSLRRWLDLALPTMLLAQAIGRWGNFFNQEAYGRPTSLPLGVVIDREHRLPPYTDLAAYPPDTRFHATFLYEFVWNLLGVAVLLLIERLGRHRRLRLRDGDIGLLYGVIYSLGRFWIEGLRTDSLCIGGLPGSCAGGLRVAQVVSLALVVGCSLLISLNHLPWRSRTHTSA